MEKYTPYIQKGESKFPVQKPEENDIQGFSEKDLEIMYMPIIQFLVMMQLAKIQETFLSAFNASSAKSFPVQSPGSSHQPELTVSSSVIASQSADWRSNLFTNNLNKEHGGFDSTER